MSDRDEEIGQNLARFRGERTQQDIADAMRSMGYKWSQATVWSVEKGERPIRLTEAMDIAHVLHVDLSDLFSTQQESVLRVALTNMAPASKRLEEAATSYEHLQLILALAADIFPHSERYETELRDWLDLSASDVVERVLTGKKIADGELEIMKDPVSGEMAGGGPWVDELMKTWRKDQENRPRGKHPEKG